MKHSGTIVHDTRSVGRKQHGPYWSNRDHHMQHGTSKIPREHTILHYAMHWGGANGWAGDGPCGMTAYFGRWAFALEGPWRILRSSRTVEMGIGTRGGWKLTKK